MFFC